MIDHYLISQSIYCKKRANYQNVEIPSFSFLSSTTIVAQSKTYVA